jgi:hypothetical protein
MVFCANTKILHDRNSLITRTALVSCLLLMLLGLSACGGGGGDSTSSGSLTSQSAVLSVSADAIQFSPTVSPVDTAPNYQVNVTINNPLNTKFYYTYTYLGTAVSNANLVLQTALTGTLSFALWSPALLGSGTYQDELRINFCFDQQCNSPVRGAPIIIPITYNVTGNAISSATFNITPALSIRVESPDTSTAATAAIDVFANELPPYDTYLIGKSEANGIVASGSWHKNTNVSGFSATLNVNLKSPNVIGPGVYKDTITVSVCYDRACTKPAIGSPRALPVDYTVTATEGLDYIAKMVDVTSSDIAWNGTRQKVYGVTTAFSNTYPSSLVEIDPTTGSVTRSLSLGTGRPTVLTVSDDGLYAYVGFADQAIVQRIALTSMSLDLKITLPTDPTYGLTYPAYLLAMPSSSRSVVISLYTFANGLTDWDSRGVYIYDDATMRPNTFLTPDATTHAMALSWGSNSSTLYAYDSNQQRLFTASASATGLSQSNVATGVMLWPNMYYLNGLVYSDDGSATNPTNGAKVATFLTLSAITAPAITLDSSLNRAYFSYEENLTPVPLWTFAVHDLQSQVVREKTRVNGCTIQLGNVNGKVGRLVRWGTNGLAFNCKEGIKIISGAFVTR